MTKMISIKNAATGEEIVRQMNAEELAEYAIGQNSYADRIQAEQEAIDKKKAILQKLGITEVEAETLLS
jgi:hypothetical protein